MQFLQKSSEKGFNNKYKPGIKALLTKAVDTSGCTVLSISSSVRKTASYGNKTFYFLELLISHTFWSFNMNILFNHL